MLITVSDRHSTPSTHQRRSCASFESTSTFILQVTRWLTRYRVLVAVRDAEATEARILAAATKEFARKGISGARIDAIASRARTNKRMLYYYFGSKAELFREVLRTQ